MKHTIYGIGGYDPNKPNNNIIQEYDDGTELLVPEEATPASIRVALRRLHGITTSQLDVVIDQAISSMPDAGAQEDARILWMYAVEIQRTHPLVAAVGSALNLNDQQIDDVFRTAATV